MANIEVDILEPKRNPEESVKVLQSFVPMYQKYWNTFGAKYYSNRPFDLQIQLFTELWTTGGSKIFVARNNVTKDIMGFIVGIVFRPMQYNANVFQVEDLFDDGQMVVRIELVKYMFNALRLLGCDELRIDHYYNISPQASSGWTIASSIETDRYVKG